MSPVHTPTHSRSFDPARPLDHTTLRNFRATGVGQASPSRLNSFVAIGLAGALTLIVALPRAWALATPLVCLACFGIWGRATQVSYVLEIRRREQPTLRKVLRGIRWTMVLVGLTAALIGLLSLVMLLLEPDSL